MRTLGKKPIKIRTVIFKIPAFGFYAEAHGSGLRLDTELVHELDEVRIGPVIENDETRINGVTAGPYLDVHGMGMPTDIVASLEHVDFVSAGKEMATRHPGNTRPDDRNSLHFVLKLALTQEYDPAQKKVTWGAFKL